MSRFAFTLISLIFAKTALAFPIFYTCEDEVLMSSDKMDPDSIFEKILSLSKKEQNEITSAWCKGKAHCLENLRKIMILSNSSYDIAEKLFLEELAMQEINISEKIENQDLLNNLTSLKESYASIKSCQEVSNQLSPEDFIFEDNKMLLYYPYHNNYMYLTGCKSINGKNCTPINKFKIDKVIKEAVSMRTDPYLAIALNLMEGDAQKMGDLYLDPIAVMDAIGCSAKQVKNGSKNALDSYGTSYIVKAQVIDKKHLQYELISYFQTKEIINESPDKNISSYYCYDIEGQDEPKVYERIQDNNCCLKVPFKEGQISAYNISQALTYEFINKRLSTSFNGKSEPEWKIQRYNGYTDLMGAAEGVPSWRMGVNYYDNPGYGQQVMDIILNSLLFNPYIKNKVEEVMLNSNSKWKSIMCRDKRNGTYYYDSDYYFNLVKNSKRLEAILDKFNKINSVNDLSQRELDVLKRELSETSQINTSFPTLLTENQLEKYEDEIFDTIHVSIYDMFKQRRLSKEEFLKLSNIYKKNELELIYDNNSEQLKIEKEYLDKDKALSKAMNNARNLCHFSNLEPQEISECDNFYENLSYDSVQLSQEEFLNQFSNVPPTVKEYEEELRQAFQNMYNVSVNEQKSITSDLQKKIMKICKKDPLECERLSDLNFALAETEIEALERYSNDPNYNSKVAKIISALYRHEQSKTQKFDYNTALDDYIKNVYPKRNTLGNTSDYSWRKFTEKDLKKMLRKIKNSPTP